jgi:uncharacterized protein (DUF3820 family)
MKYQITRTGPQTIKETTDKVCACGGKINIIYVNGGLADWCNGCHKEQRHAKVPNENFEWPMGKYVGTKINKLPSDYMVWFVRNVPKRSLVERLKTELNKRNVAF